MKDLPSLTPSQLMSQFVLLYNQMPKRVVEIQDLDDIFDEENKSLRDRIGKQRVDSDEFTKAAAFLEALLNLSPTTTGFDFYLMQQFRQGYGLGIDHHNPTDPISVIVKSDRANEGAFFNPEFAKDYERQHYKRYLEMHLQTNALLGKIHDKAFGPGKSAAIDSLRLSWLNMAPEEIEKTIADINDSLSQALGYPFNAIESIDRALARRQEQGVIESGRRWIGPEYQTYTKGSRIDFNLRQHPGNPFLGQTSHDVITTQWRAEFVEKYNDEP